MLCLVFKWMELGYKSRGLNINIEQPPLWISSCSILKSDYDLLEFCDSINKEIISELIAGKTGKGPYVLRGVLCSIPAVDTLGCSAQGTLSLLPVIALQQTITSQWQSGCFI